ncbi:DNA-binding PadR family transcriptional regulator [Nocardioides salarius]|uniref:DNA-binding PadR family transcriptional regulator n=1 Tax=Nocardioides salarius TaxID=374513 RepID=A0ABS2M9I1_9ACTN|nr:PadR family transcriptional regulator [Nocardioides salarius]MBM7507832.1 DNA-binding PadR family transcriptional regulator [Nocardioides salarius]
MSLRHALLSLLSGRERTGYEASTDFGRSVEHVWHAPDSQIYPELRRLADLGLLDVDELPDGGRGTKKRYRITETGLAELRAWIESPTRPRPQRDPAYLRAAYLEWASPEAAREVLGVHRDVHLERLRMLEQVRVSLVERTNPTLVQRLRRYPAEQHDRIVAWKVYAYDGMIAQARAEVAWAEQGLELVERFRDLPPLGMGEARDEPGAGSGA